MAYFLPGEIDRTKNAVWMGRIFIGFFVIDLFLAFLGAMQVTHLKTFLPSEDGGRVGAANSVDPVAKCYRLGL